MIFRKNKKGSHVGMVLSFTLFITFLIFAYIIVGPPISWKADKSYTIESIKNSIFENLPENLIVARAYDLDNELGCIQFELDNSFDNPEVIVKDINGVEIGSYISGNDVFIEGGNGFMEIYVSNNSFENGIWSGSSCVTIIPDNVMNEERITERGLIYLIDLVENNYNEAREYLDVRDDEFSIQFMYNDTYVLGENKTTINGNQEIKTDIYARTFKVNYLDVYGEEKIGGLIIKVW